MDASVAYSAQSSTTYYLNSKQRILHLGFAAFVILTIVGISFLASFNEQDPEWFPVMMTISSMLFGPLVILFVVYAFRSRVILSPSGIEIYSMDRSAKSSWDNINCIGEMSFSPLAKPKQGLILREPAVCYKWWVIGKARRQLSESGQDRFIDLQSFANDWRNSDLGREIRRYAPHLFESDPALSNKLPETIEAASPPAKSSEKPFDKIGGWLIPVGIWLIVNLISSLAVIAGDALLLLSMFTKSPPPGKPSVLALIAYFPSSTIYYATIFEMTTNALLVVVCLVLLVLFFQKSRRFIKTAFAYIVLRFFFGIADFAFLNYAQQTIGAKPTSMLVLNGLTISSALFMRYLMTSKRVKETFVN